MADISDDLGKGIAARVRAERSKREWSLADLAVRADVSKAMLSAIERGEASPTAVLLIRISAAFGMTLSALIARAEAAKGSLARSDAQPLWTDPETGYVRRHLSPDADMPLEMTGAEMVVQALKDNGVEHIFGYPGGAVLPIYDEIFQQDDIQHILVRHEQGAGHAAEGYARSTGKVGVVLVTSGPGATNA
jgi:transcriptional regulator with XRE-family HTH domain